MWGSSWRRCRWPVRFRRGAVTKGLGRICRCWQAEANPLAVVVRARGAIPHRVTRFGERHAQGPWAGATASCDGACGPLPALAATSLVGPARRGQTCTVAFLRWAETQGVAACPPCCRRFGPIGWPVDVIRDRLAPSGPSQNGRIGPCVRLDDQSVPKCGHPVDIIPDGRSQKGPVPGSETGPFGTCSAWRGDGP
ncbi:hypothetical protein CLV78_101799 [Aliiruegeria haliotis]|uniref:Uncharacterized protein n=1 Tax=Aliiruegeria haliotis TaxID=1280846 RepID=A0A2T0RZT8_9RHOB|nr:hypothetical protein CLV78_101799 [Aliiruegeria haliotis]